MIPETEGLTWMREAQVKTVGGFLVVTPSTPTDAVAYIVPLSRPHFPMIILDSSTSNGIPRGVQVWDGKMRSITLNLTSGDGIFRSFAYGTGIDSNSVSYIDNDMNGVYNVRLGPIGKAAVRIGDSWYPFTRTNGQRFVQTPDGLRIVTNSGGEFRFVAGN